MGKRQALREFDANGALQGDARFRGARIVEVRWSGGFVVLGLRQDVGDGRWVVVLDPAAP